MAKTAMDLVKEAMEKCQNLSVEEFAKEVEGGVILVDLREADELRKNGKIAGAVHAPRGMLEFYADASLPSHLEEFDPSQRIILYCGSGRRSALACQVLQEMGYSKVAHLDGGFKAWKEAARPIEGGE